jgi:hypothetical protein
MAHGTRENFDFDTLHVIQHLLATGDPEDITKLRDLDVLSADADVYLPFSAVMLESWRKATNYKPPKSMGAAIKRTDEEGKHWLEAGCEELDWFLDNDKARICKSTDVVPPEEIPPYAWLEKTLVDIGVRDIGTMNKTRDECISRMSKGGTIDEVFEIMRWTWALMRKMEPLLDTNWHPTGDQVFKKCRARCCLMGNRQTPMATYDPLRVSAAVVHPASLHLVNILILSFGLHIVKLDDPKAFCKGELLYAIYAHCPPGLDHIHKYAPFGKDTRWCITGAIYGLIQASLK